MKNADLFLVGQIHNNNGCSTALPQPDCKGSLGFLLWSKDGVVVGAAECMSGTLWQDLWFCLSYFGGSVDLQRALGPCKEIYSYRMV